MLRKNKTIALGYKDESYPPIPTAFTRYMRRNYLFQFWMFIVLNIKIMRIVIGGHS